MSTAVVVGSGPNGLAAAIRLARAGVEVTVLEAGDTVGGGTRTSENTLPGVLHDDCAAFHPTGVVSPFFASLDLGSHGLEWLWPEIDLAHPLDDGRAGVVSRDLARTVASLGADGAAWERVFGHLADRIDDLIGETLQPIVHLPRHPVLLGRFGMRALLPATVGLRAWEGEAARALFTGVAAHGFGRLDRPLSSAVGLMLTAIGHAAGWPVARGGSIAITDALVSVLTSLGGTIRTGVRVDSLDQLGELAGPAGRRPDIVMLDTAPRGALEILGDELPARITRALAAYRYGPAAYKVDYAIEGEVPWTNAECRLAGTLHLGGTAAQIADAELQTSRGLMPERPYVLAGQQYLADPSRSAGGINPFYAYAHVPHGYTGDATEAVTAQVERFAPGFRDRIVATYVRGPVALERYNANYVGGDIAAGANDARQILMRPRIGLRPYALGVPGVYLCSSATPPGAGVHGMNGLHAAEAALAAR